MRILYVRILFSGDVGRPRRSTVAALSPNMATAPISAAKLSSSDTVSIMLSAIKNRVDYILYLQYIMQQQFVAVLVAS